MSTPSGQIAHLGGTNSTLQSSPQKRTLSWITSFNLGFGKKNPQATERRSPAGVPRLNDAAANDSGSVSLLLCIPSGFDLGTPGFQDNRVCRFHFSLRLEKMFLFLATLVSHASHLKSGQLSAEGHHQDMPANAPNSICNQLFGENGPGMPSDAKDK